MPHPVPYAVVPYAPGAGPSAWPDELRRIARPEVLERWGAVDRAPHAPRLVAVPGDGGWAAAALVTARPGTAYAKIVDAVGDVPAAARAVVAYAEEQGLVQVVWEGWTVSGEEAAAAGFAPLRPPLPGGTDEPAGPRTGYVRWTAGEGVAEPAYYRQSTHFSCGAVTALLAQVRAGVVRPESLDREAELTLWRDATNFPACEPVGLGVAVRRRWPSSSVEVFLDTEEPVLLDHLDGDEREWRAVLQRASRTDADRLGVPVHGRRLSLAELREAVTGSGTAGAREAGAPEAGAREAGAREAFAGREAAEARAAVAGREAVAGPGRCRHVLLLVSLATMQGFDVPHWVLCHGAVPGAVVVEDPWFNTAAGETWVDAHLLPVADGSLDAMSLLGGEVRVRGAVLIDAG
ncbi:MULTISPECIES: peptidase C39 family protein [Streptomyces]|uniref:peptidase C39 family protein n=1 Tax=Streptomyces TaxID=1883 RepID=UPI0004BE0B46|nr:MULTISPECIES: peptidase C39 family protein [Streptomyces]KOG80414.1 acetyltransferase [Streptomyces griseus subsp. rhodochrous]